MVYMQYSVVRSLSPFGLLMSLIRDKTGLAYMSGDILSGDILSGDNLSGDILSWDILSWDILSWDILSWDILSGTFCLGTFCLGTFCHSTVQFYWPPISFECYSITASQALLLFSDRLLITIF